MFVLISHKYRLLKSSSWGILIDIEGQIFQSADELRDVDPVNHRIALKYEMKWAPSEEERAYLKQGILLVATDIQDKFESPGQICVRLTRLDFNPTDYQEDGLVAAISEWSAKVLGFVPPPIAVEFDLIAGRYVYAYPVAPCGMPTRIDVSAPPSTAVDELLIALIKRLFSGATFQALSKPGNTSIRNVSLLAAPVDDFILIPGNVESPTSTAEPIRFQVKGRSNSLDQPRQLTIYFGRQTEQITQLRKAVSETLWANEMLPVMEKAA